MKQIITLLLATLNASAQLTITSSDPNGSYLWESENLKHWTRSIAFSNSTTVAIGTEPVKVFKTEARQAPAVLTIIDLRGTIVFQSSKVLTNIIATNALGTFQGQVEFRSYDTNGVSYSQGRFETMPLAGSVTVVATDCDGFIATTNVTVINAPVEYETPKSDSLKRSAAIGFSPAAAGDVAGDYWVMAHSITRFYETKDIHNVWKEKTAIGQAGINGAMYRSTYRRGANGVVHEDCSVTYRSATNWIMRIETNSGPCWSQPVKSYPDVREISSYNDTAKCCPYVAAERFLQTVTCSVMAFTGSNGIAFNNHFKVDYQFYELEGRTGDELGGFRPIATPSGVTIGSTGLSPGSFVPCLDNSMVDVTPNVPSLGKMLRFDVINFRRF